MSSAQSDTVYTLPEARIVSKLTTSLVEWDSSQLQQGGSATLTEQMQQVPEVFVRNYGPGSLGTLSLMGGSASHTGIKWQGISLRNPMLGQNDLSLIPTHLFDQATIDVSGASAEHGNSQLNGTILLSNNTEQKAGVTLAPEVGEWSRWGGWAQANWSTRSLRSQFKVYGQTAENDFRYRRTSGDLVHQSNARVRNFGILQNNQWQDRQNRSHSLALWWQDAYQRIPPLTTQTRSEADQRTESIRIALDWNENEKGVLPSFTLGWVHEKIDFRDPRSNLNSPSSFHNASLQIKRKFKLSQRSTLDAGLSEQFLTASISNYGQTRHENQFELYGIYASRIGRGHYRLAMRQGISDTRFMPFAASLRVEYPFGRGLRMLASLSRDTRFVTLNEKYWIPGGNEDIEEESSIAQTLKLSYNMGADARWSGHMMVFNRNTDNWIQWTPDGNQFIWSPSNLSAVWSRGFSILAAHQTSVGSLLLNTKASYSLTKSTNKNDIQIPRLGAGEQVWYTPVHQVTLEQSASLTNLQFSYQHRFTGSYNGIMQQVPSFHIAQIRTAWLKPLGSKIVEKAWLLIDNLWNEDYRMIENRPMPRRNIRIGLHLRVV